MNDEIVTRLRFEYASCECSGINHDCERCTTDKEAADEIERLRNDVKVRDLQILANFKAMDAMHKELYGDAN